MRNALMAVDAGHAASCKRFMRARRRRRLFRECHGGWRMTAATLGRVVRFQLRPDLLCERQSMCFILCGRVELTGHVTPNFGRCLNVPHQAGKKCRRHVTVAAACLNSEYIRVMQALRVLLEGRAHFVAGRAELIGFGIFETTEEAAGKSDSDDEGNEPASWYSEKVPALRAPPEPLCNALGRCRWRCLRRCHVGPALAAKPLIASIEAGAPTAAHAGRGLAARVRRQLEAGMSAP